MMGILKQGINLGQSSLPEVEGALSFLVHKDGHRHFERAHHPVELYYRYKYHVSYVCKSYVSSS